MQRSKHLKDTYTVMPRRDYLQGVKSRLMNDVQIYFDKLEEEANRGEFVGFWGSARLIFPVIEAVAKTMYRTRRNGRDDRVQRLLKQLGVSYPELVWQMYRNSLSHNDHLANIHYGRKNVGWSITTSAGGAIIGHIFRPGMVHIDTRKLFIDFCSFLDEETQKSTTSVRVKTGLYVGRKYGGNLKKEVEEMATT